MTDVFLIFDFITSKLMCTGALIMLWPVPLAAYLIAPYMIAAECRETWISGEKEVKFNLSTKSRKIGLVVMYVFALPFLMAYYGKIWPSQPLQYTHGTDSLHKVFLESLDEFKARVDAKNPVITELGTELRRYRLDSWNPPKHFYVTITDLKTGVTSERVYVSKHCNSASSLVRGTEYNLVLRKYQTSNEPGVVKYDFTGLYEAFCS